MRTQLESHNGSRSGQFNLRTLLLVIALVGILIAAATGQFGDVLQITLFVLVGVTVIVFVHIAILYGTIWVLITIANKMGRISLEIGSRAAKTCRASKYSDPDTNRFE